MSLNNVPGNVIRQLLGAIGLLVSILPAQAGVIYTFTSAPVSVGVFPDIGGNKVRDVPGVLNFQEPVIIGFPQTASLTFASALSANSTTQLHAEFDVFNFFTPLQGGVQAYSAPDFSPFPITSDKSAYINFENAKSLDINRYSSLDGHVTTDTNGNISAWDLTFTSYDDGKGLGFTIDKSLHTISPGLGIVEDLLHISSNAALLNQIIPNVIELNGVPQNSSNYSYTKADSAFGDTGHQFNYYTQQPGSFAPINQVPVPSTLLLLMAALLGASIAKLVHKRTKRVAGISENLASSIMIPSSFSPERYHLT